MSIMNEAVMFTHVRLNQNSIDILSSDSDEQKISDGSGGNYSCRISIPKGKYNYSFKGSCLVMSIPGEKDIVLIPSTL